MVAMARALMSRPKLMLMDEPSMGLAPVLVEQNFEIIKEVHEAGVAILVVEQNANVSLSIADRGYVLSTGRLVLEGKAADLLQDEGLRKAYLGRYRLLGASADPFLRGPTAGGAAAVGSGLATSRGRRPPRSRSASPPRSGRSASP